MKKLVAALLCFLMILSLFSCRNKSIEGINYTSDNSTSSNASDNPTDNNTSANYDSVLRVYRRIVDSYPIVNQNPRALAAELGIQGEENTEIFVDLYSSVMMFYSGRGESDGESPHYKLGYGYAVKDLNGDGVDELILLNEDYTIIAIYSYADGKPTVIGGLNESYPYQRPLLDDAWIDGDGYIYTTGPRAFEHKSKYRVAQDGASLETVANYWLVERMEYEPEAHVVTKYYMLMGDEEIEITESEYKALDDQHGKYLGQYAGKEVTAEYAGLTFIPLFSEAELLPSIYESVLNTKT